MDGLPDSHFLLLWMDWTHSSVSFKLFVLCMESDEASIFLFLSPVQTVENKSRAPDIILLQQWGDGLLVFPLVKYFVSPCGDVSKREQAADMPWNPKQVCTLSF